MQTTQMANAFLIAAQPSSRPIENTTLTPNRHFGFDPNQVGRDARSLSDAHAYRRAGGSAMLAPSVGRDDRPCLGRAPKTWAPPQIESVDEMITTLPLRDIAAEALGTLKSLNALLGSSEVHQRWFLW
jgi:hypothetical protein